MFLVSGGVYLNYRVTFRETKVLSTEKHASLNGKMSVLGCWSPTKPSQFLKVPFQRSPTLAVAVPHWSINLKLWQSKWPSIPFELGCIEWEAYWNKHSLSKFPLSIRVVVWDCMVYTVDFQELDDVSKLGDQENGASTDCITVCSRW